jgi:hypothetical protein
VVASAVPVLLALRGPWWSVGGSRERSPLALHRHGTESVFGTVKTVDLPGGTFDLVTGVGYALPSSGCACRLRSRFKAAAPESAAVVLVSGLRRSRRSSAR